MPCRKCTKVHMAKPRLADLREMFMFINPAVACCLFCAASFLCQLVVHRDLGKDHLSLRHCLAVH